MKTLVLFLILFFQGVEAMTRRLPKPTITEKPMNLTYNTMKLKTALQTANQAMLIRILCDKTHSQRLQMLYKYYELYDEGPKWDFDDDFNGLLSMLFKDWIGYRVEKLYIWLNHLTDDTIDMMEFHLSHTTEEMKEVRRRYKQVKKKDMTFIPSWPRNAYTDPFTTLMANRTRPEHYSLAEATSDAKKLYNAPYDNLEKWELFIDIFTSRNFIQLDMMYDEFLRMYGVQLEDLIAKHFPYRKLENILKLARNSALFYGPLITGSMIGPGTRDWSLSYYIVTRSEIDLGSIRDEWDGERETSLYDWIMDDTSGYYRDALLAILDGNIRD